VTVGENNDDSSEGQICADLSRPPSSSIFFVTCQTRINGSYVRITAVEINDQLKIYELEIHGLEFKK